MAYTYAGRYGPEQVIDSRGIPQTNKTVYVYAVGTTTLATLYTDRTKGTTTSNPTTTSALGNLTFFADPGSYDIMVNGTRLTIAVPVDPAESEADDVAGAYVSVAAVPSGVAATDTAELAARIAEVNSAGGGVVQLRAGTYVTNSVLALPAEVRLVGVGRMATTIQNTTSDVVSVTGSHWAIEHLALRAAGGGHVITQAGTVFQSTLHSVRLIQDAAAKSAWKSNGFGYIDMLVFDFDILVNSAMSVPAFEFNSSNGDVNRNTWEKGRCTYSAGIVPVFKLDNNGAGAYFYDNVFRDINFEVVVGGGIWLGGCLDTLIEACAIYDTPSASGNFISIGPGTGGLHCKGTTLAKCSRRASTFAAGVYCFKARHSSSNASSFLGNNGTSGAAEFSIDLGSGGGNVAIRGTWDSYANGLPQYLDGTSYVLVSGVLWRSGSGTPEGSITAPVGSLYSRTDGGAGTSLYVKESGAGDTGWVAK